QRILSSFATLESPGLASVYRFDHESLRRGLDSSLTAAEMKDFLRSHTWGEVPEGIIVLIDDVARSHGTLRSSAVRCYVRSDDTALLSQAVAAVPELRSIAPTVAVSNVPLSQILEELRSQGFRPAPEDESRISTNLRPGPAAVPAAKPATKQSRSVAPAAHVARAAAHLISTMHAHHAVPEETTDPAAAASAEAFTGVLRAAARGSSRVKMT